MTVTIRHAEDTELDIVASLIVDAYAEFAATMSPDAWSMFAQDIANVHGRRGDGEIVVAVRDDKIVGSVTVFRDWRGAQQDTMAMRMLAVPPTERHTGVGKSLMQWAIDEAKSANKERLVLTAMQVMDTLREMADKLGFERAPELDHEPAPGVRAEGYSLTL
ncbi:putative acetyltransferase [Euzebya pacifica]|uniref:Putative acetyltransferase n=1 Tax=Euzebya pacifica TaxID=1608957 RepID=A0A346Y5I3_9ACTN|nr:GNAT family N-acetyltransferase [Euzebya pacifica]AXV09730.1 putative acetyltransferase [Euzebya pacifica]